jgi:hypothetical protein
MKRKNDDGRWKQLQTFVRLSRKVSFWFDGWEGCRRFDFAAAVALQLVQRASIAFPIFLFLTFLYIVCL